MRRNRKGTVLKVLCEWSPGGSHYVRTGWKNVFEYCGHEFSFWNPQATPAFDAFSEAGKIDLFLGTTYGVDRPLEKIIRNRPEMKVALFASAWGPWVDDIDIKKYPIVVASTEEIKRLEALKKGTGRPDFVFVHAHGRWLEGTMSHWRSIGVTPIGILNAADLFLYFGGEVKKEFVADAVYCGGYWGYKGRNIERYLLPLCHPSQKLNVKIFSRSEWPVAQNIGDIPDSELKHVFASAKVCPNISEPHSTDTGLGFDIVERVFKSLSSGGMCVSDYVDEARDLFTETELPMARNPAIYKELIRHYIEHKEARDRVAAAGRKKVIAEHTYFERVGTIMESLGWTDQAELVKRRKLEFLASKARISGEVK